jgi:DNA-binding MarR family transcriptional regulator
MLLFLILSCATAQDKILIRDFENSGSISPSAKLLSNFRDTLSYSDSGMVKKIATKDVIATRENYKDKSSVYVYLRPEDERLFGIRNDQLFYKADYRFTTSDAELAKECFLAKYRVYHDDIRGNTSYKVFICNDSTDEKIKIPESLNFYISVKGDMLNRNIKARLYHTSSDTTELIVKIETNKTDYVYRFKSSDIKALGIESPGAHTGRMAVNIMSMGRSLQYHNDKWFTRYEFGKWNFCH